MKVFGDGQLVGIVRPLLTPKIAVATRRATGVLVRTELRHGDPQAKNGGHSPRATSRKASAGLRGGARKRRPTASEMELKQNELSGRTGGIRENENTV